MNPAFTNTILDELLDSVARCFTPAVAEQIAALRLAPATEARLNTLAAKCNEGELSDEERAEYEAYVEGLDIMGILQAKARAILQQAATS
jgi:hypothetical protein